jgi:hypothetical protein
MKKISFIVFILVAGVVSAQGYKKDQRPQSVKEDPDNYYQSSSITTADLLKLLEFARMELFKFRLKPFEKPYKLAVKVDEYKNGKPVGSENLYLVGNNAYTHYRKEDRKEGKQPPLYFDYIDQLTFFSRQINDSATAMQLQTYAAGDGMRLNKEIKRQFQSYHWRRYTKYDWELNKDIPLLVYASSWYDEKNKVERFCGVVDLSLDEKLTNELLTSSPHYYVISYRVEEK